MYALLRNPTNLSQGGGGHSALTRGCERKWWKIWVSPRWGKAGRCLEWVFVTQDREWQLTGPRSLGKTCVRGKLRLRRQSVRCRISSVGKSTGKWNSKDAKPRKFNHTSGIRQVYISVLLRKQKAVLSHWIKFINPTLKWATLIVVTLHLYWDPLENKRGCCEAGCWDSQDHLKLPCNSPCFIYLFIIES